MIKHLLINSALDLVQGPSRVFNCSGHFLLKKPDTVQKPIIKAQNISRILFSCFAKTNHIPKYDSHRSVKSIRQEATTMLSPATLTRKTPLPFNSLGFSGNNTSYFNRRRTLTEAGSSRALSFGHKLNCGGRVNWSGRSGTVFGHLGRVYSISGGSLGDSGGIGGSGSGGGGGDSSGGGGDEGSGGNGNKWSFLSW